jgi:predicted amino acid racemase
LFLERTRRRNPELIRAAVSLHQAGEIPANCYVFDAGTFERNGELIRAAADASGLRLYYMTKQHGRNPELFRRVVQPGARETVAVNAEDARILHRHGIALGHIGNLVQVPRGEIAKVVATYRPEVISVFSVDKAGQVSAAAERYHRRQPVLLRVHGLDDVLFPGMEGGFRLDELAVAAKQIMEFAGVEITGVTTFPALRYDTAGTQPVGAPNLATLARAREILESLGATVTQVNAPGNNSSETMEFLAGHGVTHVEPGSALTASCTFHLYDDDLPEQPAMVYLTEVAHQWDNRAYLYGGGFFVDDPPVPDRASFRRHALVGSDPDQVLEQQADWEGTGAAGGGTFASIDYHGILSTAGYRARVGDTAIFGFRAQLFMTRSYSAVIEGLPSAPRLVGVWDWAGHRVGGGIE